MENSKKKKRRKSRMKKEEKWRNRRKEDTWKNFKNEVFFFQKSNGVKMSFPICWIKNNNFSARHNRIVKHVIIGETIFQDFFLRNFFQEDEVTTRRVNITRRDTKRDRNKTKRSKEKKVKRISYFFRCVFFHTNKGIKKTFFKKKSLKTQTNGKTIFEDHAWETVLWRKVEKSGKKGFSKRTTMRKESTIF